MVQLEPISNLKNNVIELYNATVPIKQPGNVLGKNNINE